MISEYKISQVNRSDTKVTVLARFYETTVTEVEVTSANQEQYPDFTIGSMVQEVLRARFSPEFEYTFSGSTTDEQIQSYLYNEAEKYGTPIN